MERRRQVISTAGAPSSPLFNQAVRVGSAIHLSGIVGVNSETGQLAGSTIQDQTRQAMANCEAILRAAGASLADVVDVLVLLARPGDFAGMNEAYAKLFPADPPARALARLGVELPGVLVSVKMTAIAPDR